MAKVNIQDKYQMSKDIKHKLLGHQIGLNFLNKNIAIKIFSNDDASSLFKFDSTQHGEILFEVVFSLPLLIRSSWDPRNNFEFFINCRIPKTTQISCENVE